MRETADAGRDLAAQTLLVPAAIRQFLWPYQDTMALFDQLEQDFERVPLPPHCRRSPTLAAQLADG